MEQKLSDTLVKAIDRSNPFMQNLQLASRFNKLIDESGADLEDNKEVTITENGEIEITPTAGKDGMKKVTATVNVSGGGGDVPTMWYLWRDSFSDYLYLPFETAPDTLASMKLIFIGDSLVTETEIETQNIAVYTKNSNTEFTIANSSIPPTETTFTRITEDVPIGGSIDVFANNIPAVYITYEEEIPDPPNRADIYVAITENGSFVDLEHLNEAKFLLRIDSGGSSSAIYTTGDRGTMFGDYYCITSQDFTVTNGKITLSGTEYNIFNFVQISIADTLYSEGS